MQIISINQSTFIFTQNSSDNYIFWSGLCAFNDKVLHLEDFALVLSSPELHADVKVMEKVPSKRHAILRGQNSMDPACRKKSTIS